MPRGRFKTKGINRAGMRFKISVTRALKGGDCTTFFLASRGRDEKDVWSLERDSKSYDKIQRRRRRAGDVRGN